jgi:ParB-like chromosome segregation protein Spo0J
MKERPRPKNVDTYIAAAPKEVQGKLGEIRKIIKKAAPIAEEKSATECRITATKADWSILQRSKTT